MTNDDRRAIPVIRGLLVTMVILLGLITGILLALAWNTCEPRVPLILKRGWPY